MKFAVAGGVEIDLASRDDVREDFNESLTGFFGTRDMSTRGLRHVIITDLDSNGDGTGLVRVDNSNTLWRVHRVSAIASAAAASATVTVRLGVEFLCALLTTPDVGETYEFDGGPVYLRRGEDLNFTWDAGPASGRGTVIVWYDEVIGVNK